MHGYLAIIVGFPLLGGLVLAALPRLSGRNAGRLAMVFPLVSFSALMALAVHAGAAPHVVVSWPWIPSMGVSLSFLVDGLSLLFAFIVSGVGVLVFFYANQYFKGTEAGLKRFYAYLTLFMAAMLGTVLADHLLVLFIFWEMTGITSFLLIGFLHDKDASRSGARMALLITMLTGLFMLVGIILLNYLTGTLSISELMARGLPVEETAAVINGCLILILLGAFGKSAQFPFHFWLPRAMEAPTPVSAYLHSATMVKLGVFLVARLYPVFSNAVLWMPVLMVVGFGTMCIAAYLALKSNQLKAILAYSTVTQLGCLTGLYGLQSVNGVFADAFHILDHVFYKACLFMVVGIVTHATGLKDLRDLGGLGRRMPVLAFATGVACASMAGLPLTMGFISKELLLEDFGKVMQVVPSFGWIGFVLFALASLMKVAFSFRLFVQMFLAPETEKVREHYHAPGWAFQLPPVLLAVASLLGGWWLAAPGALVRYLHVPGLQSRESYLAYWHGVGFELAMSLALLCAGLCLYLHGRGTQWAHNEIPHFLRFDVGFERLVGMFNRFTQWLTRLLRSESPVDYLLIILGVFALSCGGFLIQHLQSGTGAAFIVSDWRFEINPLRCFVALMIVIAALSVVLLRKWTSQLIMLSAAGFLITFYFVLYRAPDLALTQILVESATLILVLLLLARFPKSAQEGEDLEPVQGFRNVFNLLVSLAVGSTITMMILVAGALPPSQRLGLSHLEQTVPFAEGSNAVNTILVDFRGFDTLGEIAVLVIAILGAIGLFFRYKRSDQQRRQRALGAPGSGIFHTQPQPPEEVQ